MHPRSKTCPFVCRPVAWSSVAVLVALLGAREAAGQQQLWVQQLGTSASDLTTSLASDGAGGAFACGSTEGSLWGPYLGGTDAWLARFDAAGNALWGVQIGAAGSHYDMATDVEPGAGGSVFVGGTTRSVLGAAKIGSSDGWVALYDAAGGVHWVSQFGSLDEDELQAVVPRPDGGVYAAGRTNGDIGGPGFGGYDAWVARLDWGGQVLWQRRLGTMEDEWTWGGALDGAGGVYVCGDTKGNLGAPNAGNRDAWVARFDEDGTLQWVRQNGLSSIDFWSDARSDGTGGLFLAGEFYFSPGEGVLARLDSAGDFAWIRPFTTHSWAKPTQIASDGAGGLYACGAPGQDYGGVFFGGSDAFVTRLDGDGNELWVRTLGTASYDWAAGITSDGAGGAIVAGQTSGALGGPSAGSHDVWLARFDGSCGVGSNHCSPSLTSIAGCQAQLSASGSPRVSFPAEFTLSSGFVPGGNLGICLVGANGPASIPFGTLGGLLCVQPPFFRTPPKASGGIPGQCDGIFDFLLLELMDAAPIVAAGVTLQTQIWARDPANPDGFLLSDGLELTVCP